MRSTVRNMKVHVAVLLAMSLCGAAIAAESRAHYAIVHRDRSPAYYVTSITDHSDPNKTMRRYLIGDAAGPLLEVEARTDYTSNTSWTRYRSGRLGGKWIKVSYDLPFKSRTLKDRIAEMKSDPSLATVDIPVVIEGPGGVVRHLESALAPGRAERETVKKIADAELRATVAALCGVFGLPLFADAAPPARFFVDGPVAVRSRDLMVAVVPPDCDFDAKWGAPCSHAQINAIHGAIVAGKKPTTY